MSDLAQYGIPDDAAPPVSIGSVVSERSAPCDLAAERAVLGAVLLDASVLQQIGHLRADDFFLSKHRLVFEACAWCKEEHGTCDPILVGNRLSDSGTLELVGGAGFLWELSEEAKFGVAAPLHAEIVESKSRLRTAIDAAREAILRMQDGESPDTVLEQIRVAAKGISSTRSRNRVRDEDWQLPESVLFAQPEPQAWLLRRPTVDDIPVPDGMGDGLFPLGKAGMLVAEGGVGKTHVLILLAVCIITGRPFLNYFTIGEDAVGKRVLLLLAEEDADQRHRRLWDIGDHLGLSYEERKLVLERLVILPLAGVECRITESNGSGSVTPTGLVTDIIERMKATPAPGWALVGIDPLSRTAGGDMDKSNADATAFVQEVERIPVETGASSMISHHSNAQSRKEGGATSRGATGIPDGFRWAAYIRADHGKVMFRQCKSNYSRPMEKEIALVRERGGVLRAETPEEQLASSEELDSIQRSQVESDVTRVLEALSRLGTANSRDAIAAESGIRLSRARVAIRLAEARSNVRNFGTSRKPEFRVVGDWKTPTTH